MKLTFPYIKLIKCFDGKPKSYIFCLLTFGYHALHFGSQVKNKTKNRKCSQTLEFGNHIKKLLRVTHTHTHTQ